MKLKNYFFASAIAAMTLASCSDNNKDVEPVTNDNNAALSITVQQGVTTYAVDAPVSAGANTTINDALVYVMRGNSVLKCYQADAAGVAALITTNGWRIENVPSATDGVLVVANTLDNSSDNSTALKALTTRADIEKYAYQLEREQSSAAKAKVAHVTMYGACTVATGETDPDATNHTGHIYLKAAVTIAPIVGRIEFNGLAIKAGAGIATLSIDSVYMNNVYNTHATSYADPYADTIHYLGDNDVWTVETPTYQSFICDEIHKTVEAFKTEITDATKCVAYQFFPDTRDGAKYLPNIIVKVSGTYTSGEEFKNNFVTIQKYSNGSDITKMIPNKIYKLGVPEISAADITPKPYDKDKTYDVGVIVTITDWTAENITPGI